MISSKPAEHHSLLVTDFDGTMTRHDFYMLAARSLLPPDMPDYWAQYRAGQLTHFEALRAIFASIRADPATVRAVVDRMELDPDLPRALYQLRRSGWDVVVTSAGCDWYIRILLAEAGVTLPVWSNPGRSRRVGACSSTTPGQSLLLPKSGCSTQGRGRPRRHRERSASGVRRRWIPHADAARLVASDLRFVRGDLAHVLSKEGLAFHRFDRCREIAPVLCDPLIVGRNPHPARAHGAERKAMNSMITQVTIPSLVRVKSGAIDRLGSTEAIRAYARAAAGEPGT